MSRRLLTLLGALALLAAACGGDATTALDVSSATDEAADVSQPAEPVEVAEAEPVPTAAVEASAEAEPEPAADESAAAPAEGRLVNTVGGGQLDLGSIDGQDTILWFWAPW